jgi:sulfur relay (sulfurtransferase) DsrF/TusC family protein
VIRGPNSSAFALLVRSHPYQRRSARAELDVALAALVMDFRVEIYFVGSAVFQLLAERNCEPALLPAAYRAWASLPDMGEFSLFAERSWLDRLAAADVPLLLPVQAMETADMRQRWRRCDYSMVL